MKCPNCGADFDLTQPGDVLRCPYCGGTAMRPGAGVSDDNPLAPIAALLEDRNHNGIPDVLEGIAAPGATVSHQTVVRSVSTTFSVNGKTYTSLDEMPAEIRRQFAAGASAATGQVASAVLAGAMARAQTDSRARVALVLETSGSVKLNPRAAIFVAVMIGLLLLAALVMSHTCSPHGM